MRGLIESLPRAIAFATLATGIASAQDAGVFPDRKGGQDTFGHYAVVAD